MHPFGPVTRTAHPGVPADHFPPMRNRWRAVDHFGRTTALVADGPQPNAAGSDEQARQVLQQVIDAGAEAPEGHEMAGNHDSFTGSHSHAHSAFGSQGDDETHEHEHSHDGDASHGHTHSMSAANAAATMGDAADAADAGADAETVTPVVTEHGGAPQMTHDAVLRTVGTSEGTGLAASGALAPAPPTGALTSPELDALAAAGADIPQIVDNPGAAWHAYLHVEGIRTDDGREIAPGATQFPDLPVSLRFLKEDEGGHYGAETCGRIDTMEMQVVDGITACYATGVFGTDHIGQKAQLSVQEQTQRFISIDPRDVEGEYVEVQVTVSGSIFDDCDGEYDGWFRMTSFVVGAATIVPIPALQQAVITMADQPLPMAPLATERAQPTVVITASGAPMDWPANPPADWFTQEPPTVGDPRLVRQPDGKFAVPLTVTEDGRVYGHACYWGQEHTAFPGQKVKPPRSATYAHYMTGDRVVVTGMEDDGATPVLDRIAVGKITMGTGHAPVHGITPTRAKAHYDGGYGAVQVADVRAVEDDFGVWLSGALCIPHSEDNPEGPTAAQVQQFMSLDLSPDWRKYSGMLSMIALLAVPVGGFPIARESLVASGLSGIAEDEALGVARAAYDGEEVVAMVAAGRVHRMPVGQRVANLERLVGELSDDLTERRRAEARDTLAALVE